MKRSCWNEIKCMGDDRNIDNRNGMMGPMSTVSADPVGSSIMPDGASALSVPYKPLKVDSGLDRARVAGADGVPNTSTKATVSPEDIIAGEFNLLTLNEREDVYEEIHGVRKQQEESSAFIQECLAKMDRELKKLAKTHMAYSRALFLNRRYVKDVAFELMFLRSDSYDAVKAAKRMVLHFDKKLELFGHEKLTKDIRWSDLDEETVHSLQSGLHCFYSPIKDSVGRILSVQSYTAKATNPLSISHAKSAWYRFMAALTGDEQTQKNGVVAVAFSHGASVQDIIEGLKFHGQKLWISEALPFRVEGIHVCMQSEVLRPFFSTAMSFSPTEFRLRTKLHYGSHLECMYELATFGIPIAKIPVSSDGSFRLNVLNACLQQLYAEHDRLDSVDSILTKDKVTEISERDVLLGRGLPFQSFPGTVAMTQIIKELKAAHDGCDRAEKYGISEQVVQRVRGSGGRFLTRCNTTHRWTQVSDHQARERVAMGFRNLTRRRKAKKMKAGADSDSNDGGG